VLSRTDLDTQGATDRAAPCDSGAGDMFYFSWRSTVSLCLLIPMFIIPARLVVGRRLQRLTEGIDAARRRHGFER